MALVLQDMFFFLGGGGGNLVRRQVASWSKRVYIHHVHMPMLMRIAPDTDENGTQHYSLFGRGQLQYGEGNHSLPEQADATAQPLVMLAATMLATEWFSKTTSAKKKKTQAGIAGYEAHGPWRLADNTNAASAVGQSLAVCGEGHAEVIKTPRWMDWSNHTRSPRLRFFFNHFQLPTIRELHLPTTVEGLTFGKRLHRHDVNPLHGWSTRTFLWYPQGIVDGVGPWEYEGTRWRCENHCKNKKRWFCGGVG